MKKQKILSVFLLACFCCVVIISPTCARADSMQVDMRIKVGETINFINAYNATRGTTYTNFDIPALIGYRQGLGGIDNTIVQTNGPLFMGLKPGQTSGAIIVPGRLEWSDTVVVTVYTDDSAATPSANPAGGSYDTSFPMSVSLSCPSAGAVIHYTIDGSTPTASSPSGTSVSVNAGETLKAIAISPYYADSGVMSETYVRKGVNVSPSALTLRPGEQAFLSATVLPQGSDQGINWNSVAPNIATVDSSGTVTAVSAGSIDITATSTSDNSISGTCTVTVNKYNPSLSGDNSQTAKIGAVDDKTVSVNLIGMGTGGGALDFTAALGGITKTTTASGNEVVTFGFTAAELNALALGSYPISVTSPGNSYNEAISFDTGTLTVENYQPSLSGSNDFSGTIGAVGDRTVTVDLANAGFGTEPLDMTATLSGKTVTAQATANGAVNFIFAASDLNALGLGAYPISVALTANGYNEATSGTYGSLAIGQAQPTLSGSNNLSGKVGQVGDQTVTATIQDAYFGAGPLTLTANLGSITKQVQSSANGAVHFTFTAAELNGLAVAGYPIAVAFAGDANNKAANADIGALTVNAPGQHVVTLHQQAGGMATATPSGGIENTTIVLGATLQSGCTFVRWDVSPAVAWTVGGATTLDSQFAMPYADVTVTPVYNAPPVRNITIHQQKGGTATATPSGGILGTEVSLSAALNTNYTFDRWAVTPAVAWMTGSPTSASAKFTMPDADVDITPLYTYHEPAKKALTKRAARPTIYVQKQQPYGFPASGEINNEKVNIRPEPSTDNRALQTRAEIGTPLTILDIVVTSGYRYGFYKVEWDNAQGFAYIALDQLDVTFAPPLEGKIIEDGYTFSEPKEQKKSRVGEVSRGDRVRLVSRSDKWWTAELYGQTVYLPTWNVTFDFDGLKLGIEQEILNATGTEGVDGK